MATASHGMRRPPAAAGNDQLWEELLGTMTCTVIGAGSYAFSPGWGFTDRRMPNAILYVFVGGSTELWLRGDRRTLVAGDVLLSAPDQAHSMRNDGDQAAAFLTTHFTAHVYGGLEAVSVFGLPALMRPDADRFEHLRAGAERIVAEFDAAAAGCRLAANGSCAGMISLLWRDAVETEARTGFVEGGITRELLRLAPVLRTIHTRYADPLTLGDLAEVAHLTPTYFSAVFKRATGIPPSRYLTGYRLRQARHLLLSTDLSIAEIAVATGFQDPFYLSRVFKRAEGRSPRDYRRTQKRPGLP